MQNRYKSKFTWASIIGLVIIIGSQLGLFKMLGITSDSFKVIMDSLLGILVLLGILNNPTDGENF
jgi:uncharacterized membrane protein